MLPLIAVKFPPTTSWVAERTSATVRTAPVARCANPGRIAPEVAETAAMPLAAEAPTWVKKPPR